jgi:hypothetical protein
MSMLLLKERCCRCASTLNANDVDIIVIVVVVVVGTIVDAGHVSFRSATVCF